VRAASARLIQQITHPHLNPPPSKGEEKDGFDESSPYIRKNKKRWIPIFMGMTYKGIGMTERIRRVR